DFWLLLVTCKADSKSVRRFMMDWVVKLFKTLDESDANSFAEYLAEDSSFTFGNAETVKGKGPIRDHVAGFFSSIDGLQHKLLGTWQADDMIFIKGEVTYTRKDKRTLTVPFFNVFKMDHELIREYLIYTDNSALFS
ncbi:MAG: nuclear transport factor 2 family protein, partial [Candidatus Bathyarchaeia archaeon]